jgi:hypothetical protein
MDEIFRCLLCVPGQVRGQYFNQAATDVLSILSQISFTCHLNIDDIVPQILTVSCNKAHFLINSYFKRITDYIKVVVKRGLNTCRY